MLQLQLFAAFVISLAAALVVIPPTRRLASSRGWLDVPDGARKLHARPISYVGGIAILCGSLAGLIYLISINDLLPAPLHIPPPLVFVGAGLMFLTGLVDDVHGLSFKSKFVAQIFAACLLFLSGFQLHFSVVLGLEETTATLYLLDFPFTMIWVVGVINATNLVDGLDGLAGGLCLIAFAALLFVFGIGGQWLAIALMLPVMGALVGFLFVNFNPAKIFMGDSGAYLLGFLLAAYSMHIPSNGRDPVVGFLVMLVILGIPVIDTVYSMIRRVVLGRSPFRPDADHIHHRLVKKYPHRYSVLILYSVGMVLGLTGMAMTLLPQSIAVALFAIVLLVGTGALAGLGYFEGMLLSGLFRQSLRKRIGSTEEAVRRSQQSSDSGVSTESSLAEGHAA